jgi:hypothetical protein
MKRIFVPKEEEATTYRRELHNEFRNFHPTTKYYQGCEIKKGEMGRGYSSRCEKFLEDVDRRI